MMLAKKLWAGIGALIVLSPLGLILPDRFKAGTAWGRLGECQDFWAAFQAVGVNSATRLAGQSPNRGSTSLRY